MSKSNNTPVVSTPKKVGIKQKNKELIEKLLKASEELEERKLEWEEDAEDKISFAKARLTQIEPFFAMLLFYLPTYPCYFIPTMATDGISLLYNPEFVSQTILRKDVLFVLLHEIEHIFLKHNIRGPIRSVDVKAIFEHHQKQKEKGVKDIFMDDHIEEMKHILKEWNFACDYVINDHIIKDTNIKATKKLKKLLLQIDKYHNKTSEWVYDDIKTKRDPSKDANKQGVEISIGDILPVGMGGEGITEA